MMAEDPDPTTDKVGINTMLQCDRSDRGIRILQALTILSLNSLLYVLRFLATGGVAEYISMFMD